MIIEIYCPVTIVNGEFSAQKIEMSSHKMANESMINRIRKSFARATECKHGGKVQDAASILGAEPLDFSANINPLGSPPLEKLVFEEQLFQWW